MTIYMAGTSKRDVKLVRRVGTDGVDTISRLVTRNPYACVVELAANAYDADAGECRIEYDPKHGTFSITDDGSGMTPKDLLNFFILGESPKKDHPVSPGGRPRIGQFGVGTIVMPSMCRSYRMATKAKGLETTLSESFAGMLKPGKVVPHDTQKVDRALHGTEIKMQGLKFGPQNNFFLPDLLRALQWEFELPGGFQMYLNNKPVEPKNIPFAKRIDIDESTRGGRVQGTMYLLNRASDISGVHVYVHGRRVGVPSSFVDYGKLTSSARNKVVGVLHADHLNSAILFDRSSFDESAIQVINFRKLVSRLTNTVASAARKRSQEMRKARTEANVPSAVKRLAVHFLRAGVYEFDPETEILVSYDDPSKLGGYNVGENRIYLNANHPSLVVPPGELNVPFTSRVHHEKALEHAVVDVLAEHLAGGGRGKPEFAKYSRIRNDIWARLKKIQKTEKKARA
jgi:hypothetical protein